MKQSFKTAADSTKLVEQEICEGKYASAVTILEGMAEDQRDTVLSNIAYGDSLLLKQKPGHFIGATFIDHLTENKNFALMSRMVELQPDTFSMGYSDILKTIYKHANRSEMLEAIFKASPFLERDFDEEMSYQSFLVQAEYCGHHACGRPAEELYFHDVWLPQADIRALCF